MPLSNMYNGTFKDHHQKYIAKWLRTPLKYIFEDPYLIQLQSYHVCRTFWQNGSLFKKPFLINFFSISQSYSTPLQSYMQQLLIYKGFTPIGSYFNKFVLREFAQEDKKLEVHKLFETDKI